MLMLRDLDTDERRALLRSCMEADSEFTSARVFVLGLGRVLPMLGSVEGDGDRILRASTPAPSLRKLLWGPDLRAAIIDAAVREALHVYETRLDAERTTT